MHPSDMSNITKCERSIDDGEPIELYKFTQQDINYLYTSNYQDISITVVENNKKRTEKYFADHIMRAELKPNTSGSGSADMQITVWKDHPVAKLFQGSPPEYSVTVKIYRVHAENVDKYDVVFYGVISQATFKNSQCDLTAKLENWLDKELPRGMHQYFCNNMIYDKNCRLKKTDWQVNIFIGKVDELEIYSLEFANFPDGYFAGGCIYYDNQVRMIDSHVGATVMIRYPFLRDPHNSVLVTPGCGHLFSVCAEKFKNTDNFAGCPYLPPTDSEKNPVGKGAYWVNSAVIQRDSNGFIGTISL